ncbi:carbon-nitrogen hydrolase family protein [Elioraea tepida]|uniref:Carbon-nitrogen hydrolase family protein n=1 Tax=Elioraea tepida TaxID=2843330 RepID=A0A975U2W9_9PROT|nr:carbon-nitrogen hydrolase family protein [Elioraea tepida]QXM25382.1 carbon-nitrogen hydrolase family protein [Elioraea tepida]
MRVTVVQMNPGADKAANIAQAEALMEAAIAADRPDLIALPEMWTCLGGDRATKFAAAEALPAPGSNDPPGPAYAFLQALACRHRLHVHGGSIGEAAGDRLYNTTVAFDREGREVARYRKIHLFDITTPDGTGYRESATFGRGTEIVTYQADGTTVGCAICYDLRFPELFLALRRRGAELILLPSAFTLQTGKDHWETLIRARAIETQCWIAAPATWGRHEERGEPRYTWGHSLVADPWGHVVAKVSDGTGFATARIDHARTAKVRADMPVLDHRVL